MLSGITSLRYLRIVSWHSQWTCLLARCPKLWVPSESPTHAVCTDSFHTRTQKALRYLPFHFTHHKDCMRSSEVLDENRGTTKERNCRKHNKKVYIHCCLKYLFFFFFFQVRNHSMIKINHSRSYLTSTQQPSAYMRRDFSLFTNPWKNMIDLGSRCDFFCKVKYVSFSLANCNLLYIAFNLDKHYSWMVHQIIFCHVWWHPILSMHKLWG